MAKKKSKQKGSKPKQLEEEEPVVETKKKEEPAVLLADDDSSQDSDEDDEVEKQSISTEEGSVPNENTKNPAQAQAKSQADHGNESDDAESDEGGEDQQQQQQQQHDSPTIEPAFHSDGRYHNKQRCLILCSRGVTSRFRHLLEDLRTLIPHHKKDSKLDVSKNQTGGIGAAVNEIAEMRGCNSVLFIECRKRQDAYLWLGHTGVGTGGTAGPSARFLIENIHTMDELRLTGNCMKGSRPLLSFDDNFDQREELKLLKCLFTDVFGTPRGHPKSKPFVDRVMGFYYADGKVSTLLLSK